MSIVTRTFPRKIARYIASPHADDSSASDHSIGLYKIQQFHLPWAKSCQRQAPDATPCSRWAYISLLMMGIFDDSQADYGEEALFSIIIEIYRD